jgi:hypothetical protein
MKRLPISKYLEKIGIKITLFYVTRESLDDNVELNLKPKLEPVTCSFLSPAGVRELYDSNEEIKYLAKEADNWQQDGCLCFAVKHNNQYTSYTWCNLRQCNSELYPFPLKQGEAYLFRARTLIAYRGKNLAPFLRYELYKDLAGKGYTRFYSITGYFNEAALSFKKKLKAENIKLCLYLGLFHRRILTITLKEYH